MKWNPIFLGIIDDTYTNSLWILPLISVIGFLFCFYRYKLAWIIIPIVSLVSAVFLIGFLEPQNYTHIQSLSNNMPRNIATIIISFILPFIGTFLNLRKSKIKQTNLS
jgi:hypothetical protein